MSGAWPNGFNGWVDEPMYARSRCGRWLEHPDVAGSAGTWRFARWSTPSDGSRQTYALPAESGSNGQRRHQVETSARADMRERADRLRGLQGLHLDEVACSGLKLPTVVSGGE